MEQMKVEPDATPKLSKNVKPSMHADKLFAQKLRRRKGQMWRQIERSSYMVSDIRKGHKLSEVVMKNARAQKQEREMLQEHLRRRRALDIDDLPEPDLPKASSKHSNRPATARRRTARKVMQSPRTSRIRSRSASTVRRGSLSSQRRVSVTGAAGPMSGAHLVSALSRAKCSPPPSSLCEGCQRGCLFCRGADAICKRSKEFMEIKHGLKKLPGAKVGHKGSAPDRSIEELNNRFEEEALASMKAQRDRKESSDDIQPLGGNHEQSYEQFFATIKAKAAPSLRTVVWRWAAPSRFAAGDRINYGSQIALQSVSSSGFLCVDGLKEREGDSSTAKHKLKRSITLKILNAEDPAAFGPVRFSDSIFLVTMDERFILSSAIDHLSAVTETFEEDPQPTGEIKVTLMPIDDGDIRNMHGRICVQWVLVDPRCGFAIRGARQLRHAFRGASKKIAKDRAAHPDGGDPMKHVQMHKRSQMDQSSLEHIVQVQEQDGEYERACKHVHHLDEVALEQGWFRLSDREVVLRSPTHNGDGHRLHKTKRVLSVEHSGGKLDAFAVLKHRTGGAKADAQDAPIEEEQIQQDDSDGSDTITTGNRDRFRWKIQILSETRTRTVVYVRSKLSNCLDRLEHSKNTREKSKGLVKKLRSQMERIRTHMREADHPGSQLLNDDDTALLDKAALGDETDRSGALWKLNILKRVRLRHQCLPRRPSNEEREHKTQKAQKISFPRAGITSREQSKAMADACEAMTHVGLDVWDLLDKQDPGLEVFSAPTKVKRGRAAKKIQQAWRRAHGKTWRQVFRHHDDVLLRQLKQEEHEVRIREEKKLIEAQKRKRLEAERKQNYLDRSHVRTGGGLKAKTNRVKKRFVRRKRRPQPLHTVRFRA